MTVAKTVLPADEEPWLRRWMFAAATVVLVHAAIVFWLLYIRELQSAGAPPEAIMIELAPLDVAPPAQTIPDVTPGPQMTEAEPEDAEQPQTIPVPELPPVPKPNVVLMAPPKPKPKPKKFVKEVPKPVVKPDARAASAAHERAAPRGGCAPGGILAGVKRGGGFRLAQLLGCGLKLEQTLSGSGAGKRRTRHGSARPHDWPQRPCHIGACYREFRVGCA